MKKYICVWGDGYTAIDAPAIVEPREFSWFTNSLGYTDQMITDIDGLYIGECLELNDSGIHSVVRTH